MNSLNDTEIWLSAWKNKMGRPLRVLHIGNIANNAYLNAKILNRYGLECDVMCNDYYHIMGCPEWEEADFDANYLNETKPDWRTVDLHGFKRPDWFVQAPIEICYKYLAMRSSMVHKGYGDATEQLLNYYNIGIGLLEPKLGLSKRIYHFIRYRSEIEHAIRNKLSLITGVDERSSLIATASYIAIIFAHIARKLFYAVEMISNDTSSQDIERQIDTIVKRFREHLEELTRDDFAPVMHYLSKNSIVMKKYDIIHAYATYGIVPQLMQCPYVAYEHGTIRNIPFQATPEGRLCYVSYKMADHVFITNADNIKSVKKLGIEKYSFVPHPINEDHIACAQEISDLKLSLAQRFNANFIAFHPSRQHWDETRHPDWEKGNDIFIKGLARFIREVNPRGAAIFVDWGQMVAESKQLLEELGIGGRVLWLPPLPNREMIRYIHATDVVADQFYLGAFGSTMPKALACGKPSLLYLNEDLHNWCFDEMPPVINCSNPEDVFQGLKRLYEDSHWTSQLSADGRRWYEKYHSNKVIVERLLDGYKRALDSYERKKGLVTDKK